MEETLHVGKVIDIDEATKVTVSAAVSPTTKLRKLSPVESNIDSKPQPLPVKDNSSSKQQQRKRKVTKSPTSKTVACTDSSMNCRLTGFSKWIGAHISSAGGPHNVIPNALREGCNAMSFFLKSSRSWKSAPYTSESITQFKALCQQQSYNAATQLIPHGSYLINLGNPDNEKREQSYSAFADELRRCHTLGIQLYNLHPGSTVGKCERQQSIAFIAECINRAHDEIPDVVTVIENMAGQGNTIGSTFEELHGIIQLVRDQDRIGVCLDTCHMFAAGYDIRTEEAYNTSLSLFDKVIGFRYLRAVHLNDSKEPFNSKKDRHANIGEGHIGLDAFKLLMNDTRFDGMPLILETPDGTSSPTKSKRKAAQNADLPSVLEPGSDNAIEDKTSTDKMSGRSRQAREIEQLYSFIHTTPDSQ